MYPLPTNRTNQDQDFRRRRMKKLLATSILLSLLATTAISTPNTGVIRVLCNSGVYTAGDPFTISVAYVLSDLAHNTPTAKSHEYHDISPYPNAFAYGHATCSPNLTAADCSSCLTAAIVQLNATCSMRIGARTVLNDCSIRYEQYPFDD